MSRTTTAYSIVGTSLPVLLALAVLVQSAQAATPAEKTADTAVSPATAAFKSAGRSNKYLFIYCWRDDTQQSRVMRGVFQSAMEKVADKADAIELRIGDPAEKELVDRYSLTRSPMPLVLAFAPNGAITKGLPVRFDENQLRQAFVSPCTADCMKALQERKLVLLCVQSQSPKVQQVSLQKGVQDFTADKEYAESSKVVVLNASDAAEGSFLKDLRVDPRTAETVTVLMTPPGSVVGTFTGEVTKEQLVAKLKSAQSGCCPGGKCGPGGCCPAK